MDYSEKKRSRPSSLDVAQAHDQRIIDIRLETSFKLLQQAQEIREREQKEALRITAAREKVIAAKKALAEKTSEQQKARSQKIAAAKRKIINESVRLQRERFKVQKTPKKVRPPDLISRTKEFDASVEKAKRAKIDEFNENVRMFEMHHEKENFKTAEIQQKILSDNHRALMIKAEKAYQNRIKAEEAATMKVDELANSIIHKMIHRDESEKSRKEALVKKAIENNKKFKEVLEQKKERIRSLQVHRKEEIEERLNREKTKFQQALKVLESNRAQQEEANKVRNKRYSITAKRVQRRLEDDVDLSDDAL